MVSKAETVDQYLNEIPEERKPFMNRFRKTILENIPAGFSEQITYGMMGYVVPLSIFPDGYHCKSNESLPFVNLASQKNFIALYHMGIYSKPELLDWFVGEYPKHCKRKLDMGKSCIRFKKMEEIPFDLIAELMQKMTLEEWIELYVKSIKK